MDFHQHLANFSLSLKIGWTKVIIRGKRNK